MESSGRTWKVGELARETGITVRTLHYYEEIGLLSPARRTSSDHRLYSESDLIRLQQIMALRQFGMSLDDISLALDDAAATLPELLQRQLEHVWEQQERLQALATQLEDLVARVHSGVEIPSEHLLEAIRLTTVVDRYLTREQIERIRTREALVGRGAMNDARRRWQELVQELHVAAADELDPGSDAARALVRRWYELVDFFTGGDASIQRSLRSMFEHEPGTAERQGLSPGLLRWIRRVYLADPALRQTVNPEVFMMFGELEDLSPLRSGAGSGRAANGRGAVTHGRG